MSYNFYVSEVERSYRDAELVKKLERKRQLNEARASQRTNQANVEVVGTDYSETVNNKKIGKETLGWN